jgi:hypothetical protein
LIHRVVETNSYEMQAACIPCKIGGDIALAGKPAASRIKFGGILTRSEH